MTTGLPALLVPLADNKYLLGRRYSEWTSRAPALEAAVAAAAMTQDELGHARSLYATLSSTPDAPEAYLNEERRAHLQAAPVLDQPFKHWTEFVAAVSLFDRAMLLVCKAMRDSGYEPLRQRAAKIVQEEWFHQQYGDGWLKQLATQPGTRSAMQDAVSGFWQPTADWLATIQTDSSSEDALNKHLENLRPRWINELEAVLTRCGLTVP